MDPPVDDPLVSVILVSLLPLVVMGIIVAGMCYWYRRHRRHMLNQEWETNKKKRKPRAGGLDCSDACAIMMDDDRSDSSSTHANNLNHNTEPLPIELDLLVRPPGCISLVPDSGACVAVCTKTQDLFIWHPSSVVKVFFPQFDILHMF